MPSFASSTVESEIGGNTSSKEGEMGANTSLVLSRSNEETCLNSFCAISKFLKFTLFEPIENDLDPKRLCSLKKMMNRSYVFECVCVSVTVCEVKIRVILFIIIQINDRSIK